MGHRRTIGIEVWDADHYPAEPLSPDNVPDSRCSKPQGDRHALGRYPILTRKFVYAGGQSILVGTPSGTTLAPEGGAHQSITTPSVGLEQPGCITYEPAFAIDTEWTLLASLARLGRPDGTSAYLRLSTRPVDQTLAAVPTDKAARERRRRQVVAGA